MRNRIAGQLFSRSLPSVGFFFLLVLLLLASSPLFAQSPPQIRPKPNPWEVSAAFRASFLLGSADPFYTWSRLYRDGLGGGLSISRSVFRGVSLEGSMFYDYFEGKEVVSSIGPGTLGSLSLLSFSAGFRVYPIEFFRPVSTFFHPYLLVDLGGSYFSGIRFNGENDRSYPNTVDFAYGVGGGFDLFLWDRLIPFVEAKFQNSGRPEGVMDSLTTIPLAIGLRVLL
ncbi:MAG TPA: hypothetical protein VFG95_00365 [Nitrospiria bacterium]|nr:hypothetical protein [Nitrospiria bacterium]